MKPLGLGTAFCSASSVVKLKALSFTLLFVDQSAMIAHFVNVRVVRHTHRRGPAGMCRQE